MGYTKLNINNIQGIHNWMSETEQNSEKGIFDLQMEYDFQNKNICQIYGIKVTLKDLEQAKKTTLLKYIDLIKKYDSSSFYFVRFNINLDDYGSGTIPFSEPERLQQLLDIAVYEYGKYFE